MLMTRILQLLGGITILSATEKRHTPKKAALTPLFWYLKWAQPTLICNTAKFCEIVVVIRGYSVFPGIVERILDET